MYVDREVLLDSLTYTIPDESNWETDGDIGYLPKTIDVSLSMKFIESVGAEDRLYDMEISKAAVEGINKKRTEDKDAIDLETQTRGGEPVKDVPIKETSKKQSSVTILKGKGSSAFGNAKSAVNGAIKSLKSKAEDLKQSPADVAKGIPDPVAGQSVVADKFDGKTPLEDMKDASANTNLTESQIRYKQSFFLKFKDAKVVSVKDGTSVYDPRKKTGMMAMDDASIQAFESPGMLCMVGTDKRYDLVKVEFINGVYSWGGYENSL
jgi:hypothetical protein